MEGDGSTPNSAHLEYMARIKRLMKQRGYARKKDDHQYLEKHGVTRESQGRPSLGIWSTDRELQNTRNEYGVSQDDGTDYSIEQPNEYQDTQEDAFEGYECVVGWCPQEAHNFCELCQNRMCLAHTSKDVGYDEYCTDCINDDAKLNELD